MRPLPCGAPAHLFSKDLDSCHHGGNVHACCEGVQGDLVLLAGSAHLLANLLQRNTAADVGQMRLQNSVVALLCTATAQVPSRSAGQQTAHRPECRPQPCVHSCSTGAQWNCRARASGGGESLLLVKQAVQANCLNAGPDIPRSNTAGNWSSSERPARTDLPHVGLVDLAHWESAEPVTGLNNGLDLIATSHILIYLQAYIHGRAMRGSIGLQQNGQLVKEWRKRCHKHEHG